MLFDIVIFSCWSHLGRVWSLCEVWDSWSLHELSETVFQSFLRHVLLYVWVIPRNHLGHMWAMSGTLKIPYLSSTWSLCVEHVLTVVLEHLMCMSEHAVSSWEL